MLNRRSHKWLQRITYTHLNLYVTHKYTQFVKGSRTDLSIIDYTGLFYSPTLLP